MMDVKQFNDLRKLGKNFKITPNGEVTFEEIFCTIIKDGENPYTMVLDDHTVTTILNFVFTVYLPTRLAYGKGLLIHSGIRSLKSYDRLIAQGYNPSKTSDHFFGQNIGGVSTASGAFDLVPADGDVDGFFKFLKAHANIKNSTLVFGSVVVAFGQIIIEKGKSSKWIHLSGDRTKISKGAKPYSLRICKSDDNGKTYQPA